MPIDTEQPSTRPGKRMGAVRWRSCGAHGADMRQKCATYGTQMRHCFASPLRASNPDGWVEKIPMIGYTADLAARVAAVPGEHRRRASAMASAGRRAHESPIGVVAARPSPWIQPGNVRPSGQRENRANPKPAGFLGFAGSDRGGRTRAGRDRTRGSAISPPFSRPSARALRARVAAWRGAPRRTRKDPAWRRPAPTAPRSAGSRSGCSSRRC
jgi:hypothetical protein